VVVRDEFVTAFAFSHMRFPIDGAYDVLTGILRERYYDRTNAILFDD
jgi:hypothetical protein